MAQVNKNKAFIGSIGNVVFKQIGNRQIIQSKPGSIKQTRETKASGSEFRQCSSWSGWLRIGLGSFLAKHTDSIMHSRFTGQFYTALQANTALPKGERTPLNSDMSSLGGFEFNTNSLFTDYFLPEITAALNGQNEVTVTIPSFNPKTGMQFAQEARYAELLLYVMATNFESNNGFSDGFTLIPIENKDQTIAETVWTSPALPEGHLVLVCAKLLFYNTNRFTEKQYINSKECSPAQVVMVGKP